MKNPVNKVKLADLTPVHETNLGTLYKGDCLEIMVSIPDGSVDCFFADPPFNLNKLYGKNIDDNLSTEKYLEWCYKWIDEGIRILKPGGAFYLYNLPKWNTYFSCYLNNSLTFRHWISIENTYSLPISGRLYPSHYSLLYYIKGNKPATFNPPRVPILTCRHCGGEIKDYGGYKSKMNPKGVSLTDVWTDIPVVRHKKYKNREANELSLKLMDRILDISTIEGDMVFDPFGGSGTTYIAAELKDRRWLGVEISTTDDILERFKSMNSDMENYEVLKRRKNILFTDEAIKIREKNGHNNTKYQIDKHVC